MSLSSRQKITAALLILYWPAFFVAAHTPVPQVVREADVSDKRLHLLAYLILVFLLWFTVSDGEKVDWRRGAPWCVFCIAVVYGILDEWSQSFMAGRDCDGRDFVADLVGTCIGLCAFSFLSFWPAGLLVMTLIVLIGGNIGRSNLADLLPAANDAFSFYLLCCSHGAVAAVLAPFHARNQSWADQGKVAADSAGSADGLVADNKTPSNDYWQRMGSGGHCLLCRSNRGGYCRILRGRCM